MPLFLSSSEFVAISHDAGTVAERADAAIRELRRQLETVKADADAAAISSEQRCAIHEQRYDVLSADLDLLRSENAQLAASSERHASVLSEAQVEKHQLHLKAIGKDGEVERPTVELTELKKSKEQSLELVEQKDAEIREKNSTIRSYLDKIVVLTDNAAAKETRLQEIEIELSRCHATCNRISLEKELLEKHNSWLDEELKAKSNTFAEMRKSNMGLKSKMSDRIAGLERKLSESSVSLKRRKERVAEMEQRVSNLEKSSGFAAPQIPSQGTLDNQINAYFNSVTTLESSASSLQEGQGGPLATPEISKSEALQPQARQATPAPPARTVTTLAKLMVRRTAIASTTMSRPTEVRKPGRRLGRPALVTEEPHTDTEMPAAESSDATEEVKTGTPFNEPEAPPACTSLLRKRGPSSDPREDPGIQEAAIDISEAAGPPQKKYKEAAVSQETTQDTEPTPVAAVSAVPTSPVVQKAPRRIVRLLPRGSSSQETTQDTEPTPVAAAPAVPASPVVQKTPRRIVRLLPRGSSSQQTTQDTEPTPVAAAPAVPTSPVVQKTTRRIVRLLPRGSSSQETTQDTEPTPEAAVPAVPTSPVVQRTPRRIVRLLPRGSTSSSVRKNPESSVRVARVLLIARALVLPQQRQRRQMELDVLAEQFSYQRARENAALRQARISPQPQSVGCGCGRGQSGTNTRATRSGGGRGHW